MSIVKLPGKPPRKVKNLGWLLRNWQKVSAFSVVAHTSNGLDAKLTAHLRDGGGYETEFQSRAVLWRFLKRPVFLTLPLDWFGRRGKIYAERDEHPCHVYGCVHRGHHKTHNGALGFERQE